MNQVATFLLGSAMGVALGYLASRRDPRKTVRTMPAPPPMQFQTSAPSELAEKQSEQAGVEEVGYSAVELVSPEEPDVVLPEEPEIVIMADLLEEPMPGSGWEPSAEVAIEEDLLEEVLAAAPEEFEPYEPAEVERRSPVTTEVAKLAETMTFTDEVVADTGAMAIQPVDDLKARIEETRRRIRRELEQPFISPEEIEESTDWTATPAISVPSTPASAALTPSAPAVEEFIIETEPFASSSEAGDGAAVVSSGRAIDYESMKSRIESTRSRLKAKAFDAMMTGESVLLGRDPEGTEPKLAAGPVIDKEIEETIENSLREQEG